LYNVECLVGEGVNWVLTKFEQDGINLIPKGHPFALQFAISIGGFDFASHES